MRIQVKDFMSTPVITATGEQNVRKIRELMKKNGIHAIPIISYSKDIAHSDTVIKGIVTATDISKGVDDSTAVEEVMTSSNVHVVHVDSSAQALAKTMLRHNVHHMVAMEDGHIKGMVSALDFVKLVAEHTLE